MMKPLLVVAVFLLMGASSHVFGGPCVTGPDPSFASALRLTDDQRAVIASLREGFEQEFRPLQNHLLSKRSELAQLWEDADPDQAKISFKESEIREVQGRIQEISTHYHLKCRQILSPEQRKTLATFPNQLGGPRKGRCLVNNEW